MQPSTFKTTLLNHPEHLQAIGIISVELCTMEFLLASVLAALLGIDMEFADAVYTTPKASIARLEMITNVLAIKTELPKNLREEIERIVLKAQSIMGRRHTLLHNVWGASSEGVHSFIFKKGARSIKPIPIQDLNDLIRDIRETCARIANTRNLLPP